MNIKVAAFTVSKKSNNIYGHVKGPNDKELEYVKRLEQFFFNLCVPNRMAALVTDGKINTFNIICKYLQTSCYM